MADDDDDDGGNEDEANDQFQPEALGSKEEFHSRNRSGTTVIKHRTKSSLGGQAELVNRMASRWGSMGDHEMDEVPNDDIDTDSDYDGGAGGEKKPKKDSTKTPKNAENEAAAAGTADDPNAAAAAGAGGAGAPNMHRRKKSATDEINLLQSEREALESAFETYIDPEHNGDVDVDEWVIGLKKLDVGLSEAQQRKLYMFLDKDDTGFIEKNDFVHFSTQRFDNEEILALQRPILEAVRVQNLHNRTSSNLLNADLSTDWNVYDMSLLEQEMTSAMTTMVDVMKEQVDQEIEFKAEMESRLETNPDLLNAENAFKWTPYEVVHWVEQLGMERYSRYFAQENVDGPMLLEDVNEELLTQQLGVRAIHAKKIMREIVGLKKAVRGVTDLLLDESDFVCTHQIDDLEKKIAQLAIKDKLDKALKKIETMQKYYEEQIQQLTSGKKKKKKKKDNNAAEASTSALMLPPGLSADDDSLLSPAFGMGVPDAASSSNSIMTPNAEAAQLEDVKDAEEATTTTAENTDVDANDNANTTALPQPLDARAQQSKSHDADDDEDESSSDDDDDEDDEHSGRLLGMTPAQLMQLKSRGRGPSAKQMTRFLKDLRGKKQAMGDQFCIEDVDTIMEWSKEEVAYWIVSIDFEQYAFSFYSTPIDGDMLIRDMNQESIIEDLGVLKIHSARILRKIAGLRRVINEGFDEDVDKTGITVEAEPDRASKEQLQALQTQVESLETERTTIMQELESKNANDEESGGYFTTKIQELESQRTALQDEKDKLTTEMQEVRATHEQTVEDSSTALSEANDNNDELQKEVKTLKKEVRRAKRAANGDDEDDEDDDADESEADQDDAKLDDDEEPIAITCTADAVEQQILQEMEENMEFGLAKNVLYWSPAEVCQWLKGLQFAPYATVFYSAQIFGDVLLQDIGQRMLKKFSVTSMHIPKLLRGIEQLRHTAREQGVDIVLGEEVNNEMDPNYKPPDQDNKKKGKKGGPNGAGGGKHAKELEQQLGEEKLRCEQLAQEVGQRDEELSNFTEQFEEEKKMRTAIQFELEQLRDENERMMDAVPAKQQMEELENLVSALEENKMRTVRDLNSELHSLRVGCRLMQKEIIFLKTHQNKTMMDSFVGILGYSTPKN